MGSSPEAVTVVYVHGAGNKPPPDELKRMWDQDLFRRDMGGRTRMAYYADLLHPRPGVIGADACTEDEALAALASRAVADGAVAGGAAWAGEETAPAEETVLLGSLTPRGREFALSLTVSMAARAAARPVEVEAAAELLLLPAALRRLLLRQLLRQFIPDADAYFFTDRKEPIRARLRHALDAVAGPVVVVSHSLGTVIAYDVLRESRFAGAVVPLLVTVGSPLGYTEVQDVATQPLQIPAAVRLWANFADPLDIIALDTTLADDFRDARGIIVDARVDNRSPNNHAACGYLRVSQVRSVLAAAVPPDVAAAAAGAIG
jgi:hypothetical protein